MHPPTAALAGGATNQSSTPVGGARREGISRRLLAALVSLGSAGILGLAAWLTPATEGHGTHTQLGLPPCAWAVALNRPCPTCGMTTAFAYAAHGRVVDAFVAQPFGLLVALGTAVSFWVGLHIALTGSHLERFFGRLLTARVLWTLAGLAAAAWAYKWVTWPRA